jgi:UPF0148 protein
LEEEEVLRMITKFLEQGCTMLATHHSCGAPLFRCKGRIVCPVCSSLEAGKGETESAPPTSEEILTQAKSDNFIRLDEAKATISIDGEMNRQIVSTDDIHSTKQALKVALICKLREFQIKMEEEKDPDQLYKVLKCIGEILSILKISE